jgi:hypothetical protein
VIPDRSPALPDRSPALPDRSQPLPDLNRALPDLNPRRPDPGRARADRQRATSGRRRAAAGRRWDGADRRRLPSKARRADRIADSRSWSTIAGSSAPAEVVVSRARGIAAVACPRRTRRCDGGPSPRPGRGVRTLSRARTLPVETPPRPGSGRPGRARGPRARRRGGVAQADGTGPHRGEARAADVRHGPLHEGNEVVRQRRRHADHRRVDRFGERPDKTTNVRSHAHAPARRPRGAWHAVCNEGSRPSERWDDRRSHILHGDTHTRAHDRRRSTGRHRDPGAPGDAVR